MQTQKTKQQHTSYLWDGNRQLQQNTATHTHTIIYEQDSFEPVAQLIWLRDGLTAANDEPKTNDEGWYGNNKPVIKTGVQLYHYHNDHLGTPNELTDQQGDVVWYADYEAWGNTAKVVWREQVIDNVKVSKDELQPIRFQGQSFDTETGLHYNRFRYFDPDLGMFTSRDPIGLNGGTNVFAYAPNPTGWIDPFGLAKVPNSTVDGQGRPSQWTFDIAHSDIGTGTGTNQTTRDYARGLGGKLDDAGHVRGANLGGSGTNPANIFPQSINVNRGRMRDFEVIIAQEIMDNPHLTAKATVTPSYRGNSTRPAKIKYEVEFSDGSKLKKTLPNPKSKCTTK